MVDLSLCHADLSLQARDLTPLGPLDLDLVMHLELALHTDLHLGKDVDVLRKCLLFLFIDIIDSLDRTLDMQD